MIRYADACRFLSYFRYAIIATKLLLDYFRLPPLCRATRVTLAHAVFAMLLL